MSASTSASTSGVDAAPRQPHSVIETIQSLIVAFVLAMTFRGFVTEGFVIPTGSMAPTLLGQHKRLRSDQTGYEFAIGFDPTDPVQRTLTLEGVADPMLGPQYPGSGTSRRHARTRVGDRILVLKCLYQFSDPSRYDVVVFKNPTNPNGPDGNYIKRLIGLPDESLWLVDGDVFAAPAEEAGDFEAYEIQRKPEHVQRAVWQPVHSTEYVPRRPDALDVIYRGLPWKTDRWNLEDATALRCDTAEASMLEWDNHVRTLNDWAPYNVFVRGATRSNTVFVNDVRVAGTVVPDQAGLDLVLRLEARQQTMEFIVTETEARIRMRDAAWGDENPDQGWVSTEPVALSTFRPGHPTNLEFWHVDQMLSIYVNGTRVVEHRYDWRPATRLEFSTKHLEELGTLAALPPASPPSIRWQFEGSPLTLHRLALDRDIFYRTDRLSEYAVKNPTNPGFEDIVRPRQFGFGTHPSNLAVLGPDHFFMAGDNSTASSDSRLWGNPHPIVASQIDPSPFVVPRDLMLGKAWVVYFPAPLSLKEDGKAFILDFGRLRFIR